MTASLSPIGNTELIKRASALWGRRGWKMHLARLTGRDYATVKRWANGDLEVPGYVVTILAQAEALPREHWPAWLHRQGLLRQNQALRRAA